VNNEYLVLGIWVVVIAAVFAFLWWRGYLARFRNYILETREELRKCTWPTLDELKDSTKVVMVSILMLGLFIVAVDFVLTLLVRMMTQI